MLASDADRERTVDTLKTAYAEGRLTADEHDDRVGRAYVSRTYGELAALVADLPQSPGAMLPAVSPVYQPFPPYPSQAVSPPPYYPVRQKPTNGLAVASLMCGLAGIPLCLPAVAAIALGHIARWQIRNNGEGTEGGKGAATGGAVLGYLGVVFWLILLLTTGSG
ncbi:DUF1707 and DUF4190 domain-containing protein [Streptantibioticus silvisoli]|uniref:DUF1707 and DUF4190 domain-containing protein n=1 Tax=Streptantibioticus silvisoli TaxID=2705255 RepID=A0ABT6W2U7_9ACTN|nr:DUF1707 and DUF4190 domain-containing protein [Streptantibioticus silvisoli]MDI5965056.1 DUF1707 and DUF4190 domain-containing protein [Streptantibioticus silvisoli]